MGVDKAFLLKNSSIEPENNIYAVNFNAINMLLRISNDSNLAEFLECSLNFEPNKKLKIIGFHSPNVRKKFKVPGKDSSDSNLAKFLECSLPFESQKWNEIVRTR